MGLSRSEQMSRIRGRNTSPELLLRRELWRRGARYRLHSNTPGGRADVVFPRDKIAVFVDGCFWHGCPDHYVRPRTQFEFWAKKLRDNVQRDIGQMHSLESAGWVAVRFWEHEVAVAPGQCAARVLAIMSQRRRIRRLSWRVMVARAYSGDIEQWTLVELRGGAAERVVLRKRSTRKWPRTSRAS